MTINTDAEREKLDAQAEGRVMDWQPIETAPKDGTRVLLWLVPTAIAMPFRWLDWRWWGDDYPLNMADPTHWMPMPLSPTGRLTGLQPETQELPRPAPTYPDANEREAMIEVMRDGWETHQRQYAKGRGTVLDVLADALLAAGWTRKREDRA